MALPVSAPSVGETAADLLDQLIAQGLAPNNQDLGKIRQLIVILFQACILQPLGTAFTPETLQHSRDTLQILARHAKASPELLLRTSDSPTDTVPLYKFLLPRLIHAADRCTGLGGTEELSEKLLDAAVDVLRAMCRMTPEEGGVYAKGRNAAVTAVRALQAYAYASHEGRRAILYGFDDLLSSTNTAIIAARIAVASRMSFIDNVHRDLLRMLSDIACRSSKLSPGAQHALVRGLINDLRSRSMALQLEPFVLAALAWTLDERTTGDLLDALRCTPALAFVAWQAIASTVDTLTVADPRNISFVLFLLRPIPGFLSDNTISEVLARPIESWLAACDGGVAPPRIAQMIQQGKDGKLRAAAQRRERINRDSARLAGAWQGLDGVIWERSDDEIACVVDSLGRNLLNGAQRNNLELRLPQIACAICGCDGKHPPEERGLPFAILEIWYQLAADIPSQRQLSILSLLLDHIPSTSALAAAPLTSKIRERVLATFVSPDRTSRLLAGHAAAQIFAIYASQPSRISYQRRLGLIVSKLRSALSESWAIRSTAIATCGVIAKAGSEEDIGEVLELLFSQFGAGHGPTASMAYSELVNVAAHREKTPYTLISPHLERISVLIGSKVKENDNLVGLATRFVGINRQSFFEMTQRFVVPAMIVRRERDVLQEIATLTGQTLGMLVLEQAAMALSKIFLLPRSHTVALDFMVAIVRNEASHQIPTNVSAAQLLSTCIVTLVVILIIEMGDLDSEIQRNALIALQRAYQVQSASRELPTNLGPFLKPSMLGIISHLNDSLHDLQGKKTVAYKQKIIRSLGRLIETVGDSMSAFSPQVIASLQGTLGIPELRSDTLTTWKTFIRKLRYADTGPFIGRTSAALIANWADFDAPDRLQAIEMITEIADNAQQLQTYLDEVVDMSHIPELQAAAAKLSAARRSWSFARQVGRMLERIGSKNSAVSVTAMAELRKFLASRPTEIAQLTRGDIFDSTASRIVQGLLHAVVRDNEGDDLRLLGYECLGLIGALDSDRLAKLKEQPSMLISSNFTDEEESSDFAIHLIRDVLVDAFRATNDTKHQNHLAYAIQQLLHFCGFTVKLLNPSANAQVPLRVRSRWERIPKDQHDTLTPLLESRFTLTESSARQHPHPIYEHTATYREWIQTWSSDLLGQVAIIQELQPGCHSQQIFGVMRPVLKNQDVTVAHHILPHLVLHVLLSGRPAVQAEIATEINTVLQDQVNPSGPTDKRMLSAQVVFDLMDHLSKWLRSVRTNKADKAERQNHHKIVEGVLSSVETELLANAALQSKAYPRSLRNFESRIIDLRQQKREIGELQTYFERLHEIYADLDEPDGMEGVSAFVIAPSLEHQIREHESTGRWTSAQSCWEVRLQQSPEDLTLHQGLLRCLRNLGHYDTLRTHIRGILSRYPQWAEPLAPFEVEAAWIIGDWSTVKNIAESGYPMARVMRALQQKELGDTLEEARRDIGRQITSTQYSRAYEPILQLHILRELEEIDAASKAINRSSAPNKASAIADLHKSLKWRFDLSATGFRTREAILSARRTAFSLVKTASLQPEIGKAWVLSSKMARKAGYDQTAYSAVLQASEIDAPFAFVQQAKLSRTRGGALKALTELENSLTPLMKTSEVVDLSRDEAVKQDEQFVKDRNMAKAVLLQARWMHESDRFLPNEIIARYTKAINLAPDLESPYYHLGHYYDDRVGSPDQVAAFNYFTCSFYVQALRHGVKYIYRTMPRTLTVWLDLGDTIKEKEKDKKNPPTPEATKQLEKITNLMDRARKELPTFEFLTAFPQIASRVGHKNDKIRNVLVKIMGTVLLAFPQQALWPMVYLMQSNRKERQELATRVTDRTQTASSLLIPMIKDAGRFSSLLLRLCNEKVEDKKKECSINTHYPYMRQALPTRMMVPLQDALTGLLPSTAETLSTHSPFPNAPVEIQGIEDRIDIMQSLQKPKKIVFTGGDGKRYPFLCKPHDDLRKDARLMDFNSMINKLLKSASESRRRQLYIRTYAVMPLNEECGLLEWVTNTNAFKNILEAGYARHQKKIYTHALADVLAASQKQGHAKQIEAFNKVIIPMFSPTVFGDWFLMTWPEPSAWLTSRMAYCRTLAVMSMIGYVLGLGDRHGENILFDGLTGDTVHVDLNCLFDKGKTFEIPERVPFRLTQNMVEAMGVTGVEGVFRKAAEITMEILRTNRESLMSVLEAFVHDPLVEWTKGSRSKSEKEVRNAADKNLKPIKDKLRGQMDDGGLGTVPNQVEQLIRNATTPNNLALMYQGWTPWL